MSNRSEFAAARRSTRYAAACSDARQGESGSGVAGFAGRTRRGCGRRQAVPDASRVDHGRQEPVSRVAVGRCHRPGLRARRADHSRHPKRSSTVRFGRVKRVAITGVGAVSSARPRREGDVARSVRRRERHRLDQHVRHRRAPRPRRRRGQGIRPGDRSSRRRRRGSSSATSCSASRPAGRRSTTRT